MQKQKFKFLSASLSVPEMEKPKAIANDVNREFSDYVDSLLPNCPLANDPIEFWLMSNEKYPLLSPFALDMIATPASEAYAERVFSVAGELTVGKRNRTAKNLERRVFLKVNKYN